MKPRWRALAHLERPSQYQHEAPEEQQGPEPVHEQTAREQAPPVREPRRQHRGNAGVGRGLGEAQPLGPGVGRGLGEAQPLGPGVGRGLRERQNGCRHHRAPEG
jgi:hypothetical protein